MVTVLGIINLRALAVLTLVVTTELLVQTSLFPTVDTVTGAAPVDNFRQEWYARHLIAMGEQRLPEGPGETYRFLWLRSFHSPLVVRVSCAVNRCDLVALRLGGQGGYEPGSIVERKATRLSEQETARLRSLLDQARFWRPPPRDERIGLDGAQWVLEGRRERSYHLWDVWSPGPSGPYAPFRELCLEFLRLSGLTVRASEIY